MITAFLTHEPRFRDAIVNELSLPRDEENTEKGVYTVYRKGDMICIFLEHTLTIEDITQMQELFAPEAIFLPFFGFSVSSQHEVGDIIFPNTFLQYNPLIQMKEFTKEHHNTLLGDAIFLENITDQKDYHVEDFGLSLGGIAVGDVTIQDTENFTTALDFTYEADVYTTYNLIPLIQQIREKGVLAFPFFYIDHAPKVPKDYRADLLGENILVAISFLED